MNEAVPFVYLRNATLSSATMANYRYKSGRVVPQGLLLASQQLAYLFYPSVLTSSILIALRRHASFDLAARLPTWAVILSGLISIPIFFIGKAKIGEIVVRRKAAAVGAQLPPRWEGQKIGNTDLLATMKNASLNGFLSMCGMYCCRSYADGGWCRTGDEVWEKMQTIGPTYELNILWDRNLVTCDANVIKVRRLSLMLDAWG